MNNGALNLGFLNDLPDYQEPVQEENKIATPVNEGALKIDLSDKQEEQNPAQRENKLSRRDNEGLYDLEAFAVRDSATGETKSRLKKNLALSGMARAWRGDDNDRLTMGRRLAVSMFGIEKANEPALYWMNKGKPMPRFQDKSEAFRSMWDDFESQSKNKWKKVQEEQKARELFGKDLHDFVSKVSTGELADVPTPEQYEALKVGGIEWESLTRAGNAMRILKGSDNRMSGYYDMDLMERLRDSLEGDEKAKGVFMNTLFNEHKNHYRQLLEDPMNTGSELAKSSAKFSFGVVLGTDRFLRGMDKFANRAWRGVSTMGGNEKSLSFEKDTNNAYALNYQSKPVDKELERFNAEYMSILAAAEDEIASKDRSPLERTGATLGGILGDSLPMFIPFVGQAGLVASSIQKSQEEGLANGLNYEEAQLRGDLFGATDAAEELLAFGKLGKLATSMPYINKMIRGSKSLDRLAPWRSRLLKSEYAQIGASGLLGVAEEGIAEPTAGALMKSLGNLALDDERGKYKWQDYVGEISQLKDPVFMTSLLLFSGGMSATAFPHIRQEAQTFAASLEHYKSMGGTEAGFLKARKIEDAEKQFEFIQSDIQSTWKENPEAAMERSRESMGDMTSAEEVRALRQMGGFAAMQEMGMLPKYEKSEEEGKYRVYDQALRRGLEPKTDETGKAGNEEKPSYTLMSEEALDQYLRMYMNEEAKSMVLTVQNLMAGDVTIDVLKKDGFLIEEMDGTETFETLKALTDHAMAAVRALEASGMTREEALRQIDPSVSKNLPLRDVMSIAPNAKERLETAKRRGEADSFGSNAYVVRSFDKRGGMKKVLRYARGLAGVDDLWEESMEQALLSYCRENSMDVAGFGKQLQEAQRIINEEYGGKEESRFIDVNIENPSYHDCVEAFSRLGKSKVLSEARENSRLPEWLRKMIDYLVQFMGQFRSLVSLGENLKTMEQDGKLSLPIRQMLGRMTGAVEDIYSEQANLDVSRWVDNYLERARVQGEMDVRLGAGVANEAESVEESLEGLNEEQKDQDDREKELDGREIERLRKEHEESGRELSDEEIEQAREQAARDREGAAVGVMGEADVLDVFNEGRCVVVSDGVYQGFIDLDRLTLCEDVPQFKQGADPKTGVKNRIVGAWRRDSAPVSVWMRQDGRLEVISGRHRFAACADKDICCQVYVENEEHDLNWAKQHDVENNIRDGQAGMFEIARYVRDGSLTMEQATERGIARAGASLKGVEVGLYADRSLMTALENGEVDEDNAYRVAKTFPNNETQRLGVSVLRDGGSWAEAYNTMQAKIVMDMIARDNEEAGVQMGIDLFGNTDTEELFRLMGQYAARRYSELGKEMTAINGASRNPRLAKKYGIDVNDPESARKAVSALQEQRNQWKNFALHSDLLREANEFAKEELGIEPPKASANFSLTPATLDGEMSTWKKELDNYLNSGGTNKRSDIRVCTTPAVLRALGAKAYDLVVHPLAVDKVMVGKHSVSRDAMEQLPKAISEPLAVFDSTTAPNSLVVLTELKEGNNNIIVAVQLDDISGRVSVNRIRSLYGKDNARALLNSPLRYLDIKKARSWLTANRLQLPKAVPSRNGRKHKILKPEDVVKWKGEHNVSFSVIGKGSLFHDGHFEAVNAVITKPGATFSISALHASPHSFRKFTTEKMGSGEGAQAYGWGLYFAENEKVNKSYMDGFSRRSKMWKLGDLETNSILGMAGEIRSMILDNNAPIKAHSEAFDIIHGTLMELEIANGDIRKIDEVKEGLKQGIEIIEKRIESHPETRNLHEWELKTCDFLLRHLDEIEIIRNAPSNYRVELNVENHELLGWDYVENGIYELLKSSPVEAVRDALEHAERRADYRGVNVSGKFVYQELFDIFWDGGDDTKHEAQKAASEALLQGGIKGIKYEDGLSRDSITGKTYNYVIFDGNDIKITEYADGSTGGEWEYHTDTTATFSIVGEKAETFREYHNSGLTYFDPADGRHKAILDSRGVRLKREVFSVPAGGLTRATLAAVLDYEELFRAYQDLKKYTVHFFNDGKIPVCGYFDASNKHIAVNVAVGKEETLDTLLHEIQHVIQRHEGFSRGAGDMSKERALSYVNESIVQLEKRNDEWAKDALPRLRKLTEGLEKGTVDPMSVYYSSHGEKEAMLSGSFGQGSIGPSLAGMNGAGMMDAGTSIPLTGDITELGGITFDKGRFGRMATNILMPPGDWVADQLLFRIRASLERAAKRFSGYSSKADGLALFAEVSELIASAEKFLPGNYGFALEPYKIWLNVFSRLAGSGDIKNAIKGIPMSKWPEIMQGSFAKQLAMAVEKGYVRDAEIWEELGLGDMPADLNQTYGEGYNELLAEGRERFAEEPGAESKAKDYAMNGILEEMQKDGMSEEFMKALGEVKVHRLAARFLNRIVEQIDKFRKDKMLGKIRRVTSNVTPTKKPGEKPARGKMGAEAYGKMGKYIQLLEITESQYERFFEEKYPENAEEGKRYEDLPADSLLEIVMTDEDGNKIAVTCEKQEFDVYACYAKMNVEQAEKCAASLGEFISTSRNAWENAEAKHRAMIEGQVKAVLDSTGIVEDEARASRRRKEKLQPLPKEKLSMMDAFLNFGQYMDALSKYPELREWALNMKARAARASINIEVSEKNRLAAIDKAVEEIAGVKGKYEKADWLYEFKRTRDIEISLTEEEPDWKEKAKNEYRDRLFKLLSRKARVHGLEALKPYLSHFNVSEILRSEIEMKYNRPGKELTEKEQKKADEHINRVFTEKEWATYKDMNPFVTDRAAILRKASVWGKEKNPKEARTMPVRSMSRDVAANIILLYEQADYTDMMRRKGYNAEVVGQLRDFVGEDGMTFAYKLRELLGRRSREIQSLVEKRYGAPFPLVDNYFRAYFDVDAELQNKSIADGSSYGDAATGGKYGLIHSRRKHNAALDLEMGASAAFMSASREQDVFLHCSELSRDMRSFLNYKDEGLSANRSLGQMIGSDAVDKLAEWANILDRTGVEHIRGHIELNKLFNRLSGAAAQVLLSWRAPTLAKQFTAMMNGMYGSDDVGAMDGLQSMGRVISGTSVMSVSDMLATDEIGSRDKTAYSVTREALAAPGDKVISRWEAFSRKGMDNIESLDVLCNAVSSTVVYDAVYRKLQRENPAAGKETWHEGAMQSVREALEVKSQPMNHRMRSLVAQNKLWLLMGPLYLAGESVNTLARVISLARRGQYGKAGVMYLANGAVLTALQAVINFLTDDEERRKKRSGWGYLLGILAGPLSGIPLISGTAGYAIQETARFFGAKDVYVSRENTLVPFADAEESWKAVRKAWKSIGDGEAPWQDRVIAWTGLVRSTAVMLGTFLPQDKRWKAATAGASYSVAAGTNLLDFLLKTERSIEQNSSDWDKWLALSAKDEAEKKRQKREKAKERKIKKNKD